MILTGYDSMRKMINKPYEHYLNQKQAEINAYWENSTQNHFNILVQQEIGSDSYIQTPISVDSAIDMGTGLKKGDDFKIFSYKDITTEGILGLMYQYANNYWLTINTNKIASPINSVEVRRCNNILKWINKTNGAILSCPCCVDYDLASPQPLKDKDIIVGNSHIVVLVQGNQNTLSIEKNQRFIINKQPFKVVALQNLMNSVEDNSATLLYIDMYLDTEENGDDLDNNIANANEWNYDINIIPDFNQQLNGFSGKVDVYTTLNGEVVDRNIIWSGNEYVTINTNGQYTLNGNVGDIAVITANIDGNIDVSDSANITIVDSLVNQYKIVLSKDISEIYQGITVNFNAMLYNNGEVLETELITIDSSGVTTDYYKLIQNQNDFSLLCLKPTDDILTLTFNNQFASLTVNVELKSLF